MNLFSMWIRSFFGHREFRKDSDTSRKHLYKTVCQIFDFELFYLSVLNFACFVNMFMIKLSTRLIVINWCSAKLV